MNPFTFFIAAPFGNYYKFNDKSRYQNCISVTGTWTLKRRAGWIKRLCKITSTLRYDFKMHGWTNKLGLPNEGLLHGINKTSPDEVLSIAAINKDDWLKMESLISNTNSLEINLSCPNVNDTEIIWNDLPIFLNSKKRKWCIAKVSPMILPQQLQYLVEEVGFTQLHLCNTIPQDKGGGLSGPALKPYVLKLIELARNKWGDEIELISGGGVRKIEDIKEYISAGANHISLGTICFNPWRVKKLISK